MSKNINTRFKLQFADANFGILNRFLIGVRITKIKPARLLIKNLGYLRIFVQKLFIIKFYLLLIYYFIQIYNNIELFVHIINY